MQDRASVGQRPGLVGDASLDDRGATGGAVIGPRGADARLDLLARRDQALDHGGRLDPLIARKDRRHQDALLRSGMGRAGVVDEHVVARLEAGHAGQVLARCGAIHLPVRIVDELVGLHGINCEERDEGRGVQQMLHAG